MPVWLVIVQIMNNFHDNELNIILLVFTVLLEKWLHWDFGPEINVNIWSLNSKFFAVHFKIEIFRLQTALNLYEFWRASFYPTSDDHLPIGNSLPDFQQIWRNFFVRLHFHNQAERGSTRKGIWAVPKRVEHGFSEPQVGIILLTDYRSISLLDVPHATTTYVALLG